MSILLEDPGSEVALGVGKACVLWPLFFLICFGLGIPTLKRYDVRKLGPDTSNYYNMVLHQEPPDGVPFSFRLLVPETARPFYLLGNGRVGTWDPVAFGTLTANSIYCATSAFLLLLIGLRLTQNLTLALLASTLYLLNFVIPNLFLAGYVDSSESCLMLAVTWSLLTGRWWLLPLIGIPGGFAKQSFLLFSTLFAATWWITLKRPDRNYRQLLWVAGLGCTSFAAVELAHRLVTGTTMSPLGMTAWWGCDNCIADTLKEFTDREFWYAFVWLLPLGVWRLNRLPKPWVNAVLVTALLTIILGGFATSYGDVCRPLFTIVGPAFTLSLAILLTGKPASGQTGMPANS